MKSKKGAFTLVELIVVITILSILATIGFVSFSGYLAGARDTNRVAQLKAMSDALELYSTKKSLPVPDDKIDIKSGSDIIAYQGYIGKNVLETIEYTESGLDPKDKNYFSYYLTKNKKYFQLLAFLEEPSTDVLAFSKIQATDYSERYPRVTGKKLGILLDESNTPIQEISTINSETGSGYLDINDVQSLQLQSILKGDEIISGTGTTFADLKIINSKGGKGFGINEYGYLVYSNFDYDDWRKIDGNCDIADIVIGTQIWAGCNSTIGDGYSFVENKTMSCHDYGIISYENTGTGCSGYNTTEKSYNSIHGVDNIWGKLYNWEQASLTACKNGYHLPTEVEWSTLGTALGGSALGWLNHDSKTINNNLVQALKIPLSGHSTSLEDNNTRGYRTYLWTNTLDSTNHYHIYITSQSSTINHNSNYGNNLVFSVRCIKD